MKRAGEKGDSQKFGKEPLRDVPSSCFVGVACWSPLRGTNSQTKRYLLSLRDAARVPTVDLLR